MRQNRLGGCGALLVFLTTETVLSHDVNPAETVTFNAERVFMIWTVEIHDYTFTLVNKGFNKVGPVRLEMGMEFT